MVMKKKLVIYFIFILLVMNIFVSPGIAQTDKFYIDDFSDYPSLDDETHIADNNMVVDSDGGYWIIIFNDTTPYNFDFYYSDDKGDTWSVETEFDMTDDYNEQVDAMGVCIDDDDIIHIGYGYGWSSPVRYNLSYRSYNTNTDTISGKTHIFTSNSLGVTWFVYGISMAVNDDGEISFAWCEWSTSSNDGVFNNKVYNDQAEVWGDTNILETETGGSTEWIKGVSTDVLSNGTFVYGIVEYHASNHNNYHIIWYDDKTDANGTYFVNSTDSESSALDKVDIAVDSNDDIHFVYEVPNGGINYTFYDMDADISYTETLLESTASVNPQVSLNSDDTVQIVFIGDNGVTPSDWVMGYYGSYGSWSSLQYYQSGVTDNMECVYVPYQNLQSFTHLTDGVIGYYVNGSNNFAYHFDEGYELFYSDDDENGTSEGGFPQCEASGWIIEKQFADSIGYYNDTLTFVIKRTNPLNGLYAIMNSTFDVIQTGSFYGATYPTWYFVDPQYGTGTYYFVAGYTWEVWAVNCSFTIVDSASVSDLWILESTKPVFNVGEDVVLRYVIPDGEYGNITVTEVGDPLETLTISDILGTGEYKTISFGVSQVGDLCYHGYLRNSSNNILRASTPQFCIGETFFDYDILVDGVKNLSVTARDTVSISGYVQGIKADVYIFLVYDNLTRYSWAVGDATNKILFSRNWYINYNYTLGDEVYYLYLGTSYGLFEDKYVTLTVSDYTGEPTPFDDSSWYGLPFWLPFLIGVFLTLFITMSPLIIGTYITRNSRIEKINIPPLLYVGFFYLGLIISVVIGFLPSWLPFVILFAMIIYFAVTWLAGRQASIQGE